jgi:hypothetical protein
MNKIDKFEAWARETYKPKEAPWKRPALLILSLIITACVIAAYTQIHYQWTNNGVWLVIVLFSFLSIIGVFVSIKCKDFWVALVFGGV